MKWFTPVVAFLLAPIALASQGLVTGDICGTPTAPLTGTAVKGGFSFTYRSAFSQLTRNRYCIGYMLVNDPGHPASAVTWSGKSDADSSSYVWLQGTLRRCPDSGSCTRQRLYTYSTEIGERPNTGKSQLAWGLNADQFAARVDSYFQGVPVQLITSLQVRAAPPPDPPNQPLVSGFETWLDRPFAIRIESHVRLVTHTTTGPRWQLLHAGIREPQAKYLDLRREFVLSVSDGELVGVVSFPNEAARHGLSLVLPRVAVFMRNDNTVQGERRIFADMSNQPVSIRRYTALLYRDGERVATFTVPLYEFPH